VIRDRGNMVKVVAVKLLLLCALMAGCTTSPDNRETDPRHYLVNRGDLLTILVFREADISRDYDVAADGTINHPLLGRVMVAGLTPAQIEERLTDLLEADYLVDPRVSVSIARSSERPVMVFGEVRQPGTYDLRAGHRTTLLQVIARAGGFTDIAARDRVRIVRVVNGEEQSIKVKVSDLLRGRDGVTDIDLHAGDIVTVPETLF
jgi:protein involved in polysaccharide export with SLBB domain